VGLNKPGLVVKKQPDGWTSVYSSAPILPAALLRNILRVSGGHIYSEANDVVYGNKNFLCLHAPAGGIRKVRLPQKARIIDLLENRVLSDKADEFELRLEPNSSRLLGLESPTPEEGQEVFFSYQAEDDVNLLANLLAFGEASSLL